jgi:Protein of unknown function (DUF2510)
VLTSTIAICMDGHNSAGAWYPDPRNPLIERWWDGFAWTQFTRPSPVAPPSIPIWQEPVCIVIALMYFPAIGLAGLASTPKLSRQAKSLILLAWLFLVIASMVALVMLGVIKF